MPSRQLYALANKYAIFALALVIIFKLNCVNVQPGQLLSSSTHERAKHNDNEQQQVKSASNSASGSTQALNRLKKTASSDKESRCYAPIRQTFPYHKRYRAIAVLEKRTIGDTRTPARKSCFHKRNKFSK